MSYHDLSECTLTEEERLKEAHDLADMITNFTDPDDLTESECNIVVTFYKQLSETCSVKQLFWLRDIKDKYL
jgi:hypothetical protein